LGLVGHSIVTVTINPAIDATAIAEAVRPTRKIRTSNATLEPGGGGINVARVIAELGGRCRAIYCAGGLTGGVFDTLIESVGVERTRIGIEGSTRVSHIVLERSTGLEYRFVPEGPFIREAEWQSLLSAVSTCAADYVVASGSLAPGVPSDFYARLGELVRGRGQRFVLDTSGPALEAALDAGGIYLAKPSLGELEALVGRPLATPGEQERAAREIVARSGTELLAVSLGAEGALLASAAGVVRVPAPALRARSAVGAGDSFLGAMTLRLAQGMTPVEALAWGVAAGSAAVTTSHAELCRRADVERIHAELQRAPGPRGEATVAVPE
jgi:6-phosphofructokinase 2